MTKEEKEVITDLTKCNFNQIHEYYKRKSEERKAMSKEEKKVIVKAATSPVLTSVNACTFSSVAPTLLVVGDQRG